MAIFENEMCCMEEKEGEGTPRNKEEKQQVKKKTRTTKVVGWIAIPFRCDNPNGEWQLIGFFPSKIFCSFNLQPIRFGFFFFLFPFSSG